MCSSQHGEVGAQVYRGVQGVLGAFPAIGLAGRRFRVRRTRWGADPLFRGSYSYCPADGRAADMDALAAPVVPEPNPDPGCEGRAAAPGDAALPRVMFAGEATHRSYFGTVHGAFFSVRIHLEFLGFEMKAFLSMSYHEQRAVGVSLGFGMVQLQWDAACCQANAEVASCHICSTPAPAAHSAQGSSNKSFLCRPEQCDAHLFSMRRRQCWRLSSVRRPGSC